MSITVLPDFPSLSELPDTFLIQLNDFSAISLLGEDQSNYLQGQVTCDVNSLTDSTLLHGAHCDAKGKVFSVFRLINQDKRHLLIQPKASLSASLKELQKFGVFSKVTIEEATNLNFYALAGKSAQQKLSQHFTQVPDSLNQVVHHETTTLIYIQGEQPRYLLIDDAPTLQNTVEQLNLPVYSQAVWQLLEITQGFPLLAENSINQYVPQMLNLQAINGISFTKGCYLGQETVARMQYLGKNKRALFSLEGTLNSALSPDDVLEKQLGENWRKAGDILASYYSDNGTSYIQAVLSSEEEQMLRVKAQPEHLLRVNKLPYSLLSD